MPRESFESIQAAIVAAVTDGITHTELVAKIDPQHRAHLARVLASGVLEARAESVPNGAPVVRYFRPVRAQQEA